VLSRRERLYSDAAGTNAAIHRRRLTGSKLAHDAGTGELHDLRRIRDTIFASQSLGSRGTADAGADASAVSSDGDRAHRAAIDEAVKRPVSTVHHQDHVVISDGASLSVQFRQTGNGS